ncbi:MAG: thioredoxin family protein [Alphaproteobacteria bacterium]|nr:thioredoxin family protein [Alphaproteobacteria bacterium]
MRAMPYLVLFVMLLLPIQALALQSEEQKAEFSTSQLLVGEKALQPQSGLAQIKAAVEIELKDGWKTYWRSPGDAGFPFLAEAAETAGNIESIEVHWPFPKRFVEEWELEVFGFKKHVAIPLTITLADGAADTQADISISYAVCSDICINEQQELSLFIPAEFSQDADKKAVDDAIATIPAQNGENGMEVISAVIDTETKDKGVLAVSVKSAAAIGEADVFIESDTPGLRFPKAELIVDEDKKTATFLVPYEISLPAKTLVGEVLRFTFVSGKAAVETEIKIAAKSANQAVAASQSNAGGNVTGGGEKANAAASVETTSVTDDSNFSFATILVFALVGGLILNIMPCVLPVLSFKLLGAIKHGGKNNREVRQSFLASVAGILTFFMMLAAFTISAKNAGHAVGWGFHFQSPAFLTFLTVMILLFAANMLGMFEIQLPSWLNTHIYDVTGTGAMKHRHHLIGDYATGVFAALMATPCTAPMLGTAVGFALARGQSEILSIFFVLGLGLSLPYLAAAMMPSLATRLPKPGAWMIRVKQVMGLLLLIAAVWLLWVIASQTHAIIAAGVLLLSALLGAVLHGGGRWRFLRRQASVAAISVGLLVGLALLPNLGLSTHQDDVLPPEELRAQLWQPFDEDKISTLVGKGKTVVVDVTADWCLTCKYNKLRVFEQEDITVALGEDTIVAMRADMTRPMPNIQAYLKKNRRYGIPFNIVYGPAATEGIVLPELLDKETLLQAITDAQGANAL